MELSFMNENIEIYTRGIPNETYGLIIKNDHRLMRKINKVLPRYRQPAKFHPLDEPQFFFNLSQVERIAASSAVLREIFIQIGALEVR